jgi:hypothetical protein
MICVWSISFQAFFKKPAELRIAVLIDLLTSISVLPMCWRAAILGRETRIGTAIWRLQIPSRGGKSRKRWVATVKTNSTFPPAGLFNKSASEIARSLASRRILPKGPQSGMRMLNYDINRAGHNLTTTRGGELNKAKTLLSKRIQQTHIHK